MDLLALRKALSPSNIQSGFFVMGIYPLDKEVVKKHMGLFKIYKNASTDTTFEDGGTLEQVQGSNAIDSQAMLEEEQME